MGFKPTYGTEVDTYADFSLGSVTLALFDRHEMNEAVGTSGLPAASAAQDRVCLVFGVGNVDAASRELQAKGVLLLTEPADRPGWGIRTAHFRDPAGNLIEIYQPLSA
jgi:lactoylglutathione lyase